MSEFLGLRTAAYKVPDMKAGVAWYTEVLGFPPYFNEPFYAGWNVGGFELGLQPSDAAPGEKYLDHVALWGVEDIQATYDRLLSLGATEREAPRNVGGPLMVAVVVDPWGNPFGLIYNPEFKLPD